MTTSPGSSRRAPLAVQILLAAFVTTVVALLPIGVASAHTSFEESSPANGETVAEPVSAITLRFSGTSEYGDDAFSILTPDGVVRIPTSVSPSADQKVFELNFDPPIAGGQIGVRWAVNAPDAHPIDGSFSFTVTAPAPNTATPGASPSAAVPDGSGSMVMNDETTMDSSGTMVMADGTTMDMTTSLDEFLTVDPSRREQGTARWGRLTEFAAITLIIGGTAFAATTLRGRRSEIERTIATLRILGATLAVGALLEYVGIARIAEASVASYWSTQPGLATLLRGAGGLAIAAGLAAVTVPVRTRRPANSLSAAVNSTMEYEREQHSGFWSDEQEARPERHTNRTPQHRKHPAPPVNTHHVIDPLLQRRDQRETHSPSAREHRPSVTITTSPQPRPARPVGAQHDPFAPGTQQQPARTRSAVPDPAESPVIRQWVPDRSSSAAYVGVAVAIISFWFDGHTVSKGFRPLHALANSLHVIAGSVWLGGVVAMAVVLWSRRRAGLAPRAREMVVRFSGIATIALGAVIAAGGIMAFLVLDSVGELFSTQWGQLLLLKSTAAGLAMVGGAYNHFWLLPALETDPDDPTLVAHLRSAVTAEAIMLGFVTVVTASLVAAAS
jgi:methionine-rich copper-binding protein CopC